jgi:uncharacterized HhH-GPD family protein
VVGRGEYGRSMTLRLTGNDEADALLSKDPFALLVGMLLDQQMPMERAFEGPYKLTQRLGGDRLDVRQIAEADPEKFAALCAQPPAVHRFPGAMAARIQAVAQHIVDTYDGDTAALWTTADSGSELLRRLSALPGFGDQKARIFLALLGKQLAVTPEGWREAAGAYGEEGVHRSVADVVDARSLAQVREHKQQVKQQAKQAKETAGSKSPRVR